VHAYASTAPNERQIPAKYCIGLPIGLFIYLGRFKLLLWS